MTPAASNPARRGRGFAEIRAGSDRIPRPDAARSEDQVVTNEAIMMLAGVPIFSELTKRELTSIAKAAKEVNHRKGAVLAREGETGVGFFLILDGVAQVAVGGHHVRDLSRGDFFGEISLLEGGPRTATVTAATQIRLLALTQWVFKRLVEQNPAIASKMLKVMAQRLRSSARSFTD
jgi:CRP/FNR family transcriptional regulator, cyclic AMP receptor protein